MGIRVPDPPLLEGDLLLRPPEPGDVEWIVRGCTDPEVPRWTTIPSPYGPEHARSFIADREVDWRQGTAATFAILRDGEGAGMVELRRHAERAEVGYWVGSWARRRGVATRATRMVLRHARAEWGITDVELTTLPDNHASRGVAAALGFACGSEVRRLDQRGATRVVDVWTLTGPVR